MNYWTKQDGQSNKVVYQSSFEGGDEAMFYPNPDGEYNRSTAQASSGTYSLYLNAHTHNGNHYGPNIMHSFVETGDKLLIDFKAYFEADNNTWNNDEGGRMVYELLDEQGGYLYTTTGTRQWRAVHINGNAQTWRSYNVNFTIPQTYKADGTPYNGKIKIKTNAWVNILHNPTYFDEFKMQILPHDYVAPTNENYYFSAVIEMSADYHEFGMNMEGRGFSGSLNYRFGYQGSEKDNEVNSSNGTSYTTEFRQLDTRLGRWFSSDPVFQPWQSSYTSMDNNPVNLTDVFGDVAGDDEAKSDDAKVEVDKGSKERGQLDNARLSGKFKGGKYTDKKGNEYSFKFRGKEIVYYKKNAKPSEIKKEEEKEEEPKDLAIYVAFPEAKAPVGKNDNTRLGQMANKYKKILPKEYKVGHAGVIIINRDTKETTYTDFGRFPNYGSTNGNGITRVGHIDMKTVDAKFDNNGNLTNHREIVKSLTKSKFFQINNEGGVVEWATMDGLNHDSMLKYAKNHGSKEFGFGNGQTYCANYAANVIRAGGGTIEESDPIKLLEKVEQMINGKSDWQIIPMLPKIMEIMENEGPTGHNIRNFIRSQNSNNSGLMKF